MKKIIKNVSGISLKQTLLINGDGTWKIKEKDSIITEGNNLSSLRIYLAVSTISPIHKAIKYFNLDSKSRERDKVYMRFYIFDLLYKSGHTQEKIAEIFGFNHTSVTYGLKQYKKWEEDDLFLKVIEPLVKYLNE